jgi:hypothetical protein
MTKFKNIPITKLKDDYVQLAYFVSYLKGTYETNCEVLEKQKDIMHDDESKAKAAVIDYTERVIKYAESMLENGIVKPDQK